MNIFDYRARVFSGLTYLKIIKINEIIKISKKDWSDDMKEKSGDKKVQNIGEVKTRFHELNELLHEMRASL